MKMEKIYDKVYITLDDEVQRDDYEISDRLTGLLENADLETMSRKDLTDLVCKASAVGQKQGFISGVRFLAKLLCEIMI